MIIYYDYFYDYLLFYFNYFSFYRNRGKGSAIFTDFGMNLR